MFAWMVWTTPVAVFSKNSMPILSSLLKTNDERRASMRAVATRMSVRRRKPNMVSKRISRAMPPTSTFRVERLL